MRVLKLWLSRLFPTQPIASPFLPFWLFLFPPRPTADTPYLAEQRNYPRAALLATLVFFGWPISDAFLKYASESHVPPGQILMICGSTSMLTIALFASVREKFHLLKPKNPGGLIIIGLCQLGAFVFWILALPHMPLANMYALSFLAPMVIACMAKAFLKEEIGLLRLIAIIGGFLGVIVAINPANFTAVRDIVPVAYLIGNMLCVSVQMFLLRMLANREASESTAFYSRLVLTISGLVLCLVTGFHTMSPIMFLALCGSGILGGLGWTLLAQAYKYAPASAVAPLQYSQIIWGAIIGYFFWQHVPDLPLVAGSAIIMASGALLIRNERRISRVMPRSG